MFQVTNTFNKLTQKDGAKVIIFSRGNALRLGVWFIGHMPDDHCFKYQPVYRYTDRYIGFSKETRRYGEFCIASRFQPIWADISTTWQYIAGIRYNKYRPE